MDSQRIFATGVAYLVLLLSLSAREAFKAWTAELCGDSTSRVLGRVSLNPVRHLDIVGSLILIIPAVLLTFGAPVFGWGRPVPIIEKNLRDPYRGGLLVAAAGPFCNFTIGLLAALALLIALRVTGTPGQDAATWVLFRLWDKAAGAPHVPLMFTLIMVVTVNAFLTAFHLIPLPPLDGGRLAVYLLPQDWAEKLAAIRPTGFMIVMALALFIVTALLVWFFVGIILSVLI